MIVEGANGEFRSELLSVGQSKHYALKANITQDMEHGVPNSVESLQRWVHRSDGVGD